MSTKQRHSSKKEIHDSAEILKEKGSSPQAKEAAAGIMALIPRHGAKHAKGYKRAIH